LVDKSEKGGERLVEETREAEAERGIKVGELAESEEVEAEVRFTRLV